MVERVFYSDHIIVNRELINGYREIVNYLEDLYRKNIDNADTAGIIATGVFECWHKLAMDSASKYSVAAERDYFFQMWLRFSYEGIIRFENNPMVIWLVGYTEANMMGKRNLITKGGKMKMRYAESISNKDLPIDILMGKHRRKLDDYYRLDIKKLFPSRSRADKYFLELLRARSREIFGEKDIWGIYNDD